MHGRTRSKCRTELRRPLEIVVPIAVRIDQHPRLRLAATTITATTTIAVHQQRQQLRVAIVLELHTARGGGEKGRRRQRELAVAQTVALEKDDLWRGRAARTTRCQWGKEAIEE